METNAGIIQGHTAYEKMKKTPWHEISDFDYISSTDEEDNDDDFNDTESSSSDEEKEKKKATNWSEDHYKKGVITEGTPDQKEVG